ncbi:MAG: HAD family hydrolase, partial [Nitrospiraceae bacterium]
IAELFDTVTISSLAHAAKPAPQIFRLALEKHAVDPEEALHVGDSPADDVEGARLARLHAVLIDRQRMDSGGRKPSASPVPTIHTLDELPRLIATL